MKAPWVIDFDASVGSLPEERRLDMSAHQESLRFACRRSQLRAWGDRLPQACGDGPVFIGSGDFHHLSLPLIQRSIARHGPLRVLVLDNHPDNMRYPWGVHCGSWVRDAARMPGVLGIDVIGITSSDIVGLHVLENNLAPLWRGRLRYGAIGLDLGAWRRLRLERAVRSYTHAEQLLQASLADLQAGDEPLYLSIDKDVLDTCDVRTNWDQGCMRSSAMLAFVQALRDRIVAVDVTGDVSAYRYQSLWKRYLSQLDGQELQAPPDAATLSHWQEQQRQVNRAIIASLAAT